MLKDIERNVLRIIGNYAILRKRTPTIHELEVRTGRTRAGILKVLAVLNQERNIEWDLKQPE